jgi:polysaccharide chain length determinant protein (PEP-CTERM system associated)
VNQMRSRIAVTIAGDGSDSFRVSYEDESPRLAMLVTERLAGGFIDDSTRDRKVMAQEASGFLESQLEDARARLVEQEKRLETYRLQYGSELPTQLQSNIQVIQNLQTQVQTLSEGINRDRDRRLLVARQLADLQSEESLAEPGATAAGSDAAGTPASVQLATALADLRALELRVTPEHPDLLRAKTLVADLQREVARQAAAASKLRADKPKPLTAAEIARHNRTSELRAEIDSLDRQVADKVAEQAELRASAQTYQARVEALPSRESDLASLTRDYDTLQSTYRILLTKKEDSKVSENLEQRQAGQQYKILDPPRLPQRPVSPNRPLMDLGAALAGLVFGIGVAVLLEFLDKSLKVEADVRTVLNLPVLATIPTMMSSAERRRAWWRTAGFSLALVVLFATCAAAVRLTFRL